MKKSKEERFGIHKKYGVDIKYPIKITKPSFYELVEYDPYGRKTTIAKVFPAQYAVLVSKKKELIRNTGKHYLSNTGYKLKIEPIY